MPLSINHYLRNLSKLAAQWTNENFRDPDKQRIYLKDIDCPDLWRQKLEEQIPAGTFYLNESTGLVDGPGADNPSSKGITRAGDLMSCLPPEMRAENLMCYIGYEGTYTPAHREMCASLGQNLMVDASGTIDEEGKPTKPGSSIWFMTESSDRHLVSEYWLSTLGHDIEIEKHFAQLNAWKMAPFKVYIVDQKPGDFILIPPLAPHQVWNRGTRTMKVAWNRTTVETLEMAIHEALPRARMVCRDEQYKNKAIIYFALNKYSDLLKEVDLRIQKAQNNLERHKILYSKEIEQLGLDFRRLFALFTETLVSEMLSPVAPNEKKGQYIPYDSFVTCSYCRCNIFNRFLTCTTCVNPLPGGEEDTYDICMDCFAMGRSCACISNFVWVEQFVWKELVDKHHLWRNQIIGFEKRKDEKRTDTKRAEKKADVPKTLDEERKDLKKWTLAQVCQQQLTIRPWSDPKNPRVVPQPFATKSKARANGNNEEDGDEEGLKAKKTLRRDKLNKSYCIEHVSMHPKEKWKVAECSKCSRAYDYGSLWRMFDLMPQVVMEQYAWECPHCQRNCSCGACRRRIGIVPYEPKGTVLGHDTRKVADPRSMEHLVDFSTSNMTWMKTAGDDINSEARRFNRRFEEAERARELDPALDQHYVDQSVRVPTPVVEDSVSLIPIDPMLSNMSPAKPSESLPNGSLQSNPKPSGSITVAGTPQTDGPGDRNQESGNGPARDIRDRNFISNGITYEYPDPEESVPTNTQSVQSGPIAPPPQAKKSDVDSKKKSSYIFQSDFVSEDGSNEEFRRAQKEQALREAKMNNRANMAQAALTGKSLMVTLRVSGPRLASIKPRLNVPDLANTSTVSPPIDNNYLLQSDIPAESRSSLHTENARKRKSLTEGDDDGEYRQRKRDRPSSSLTLNAKESLRPQIEQIKDDSESDIEELEMQGENKMLANKRQGPRPLPKYLATRNDGEEFPQELANPEPRTRPTPTIASVNGNGTSARHATGQLAPSRGNKAKGPVRPSGLNASAAVQKLAEENRLAKMKAALLTQGDGDADSDSSDRSYPSDHEKVKRHAESVVQKGRPMAVPTSIFSRPGMVGRKIKIASAKTASTGKKG